jgi:hypothetical protein
MTRGTHSSVAKVFYSPPPRSASSSFDFLHLCPLLLQATTELGRNGEVNSHVSSPRRSRSPASHPRAVALTRALSIGLISEDRHRHRPAPRHDDLSPRLRCGGESELHSWDPIRSGSQHDGIPLERRRDPPVFHGGSGIPRLCGSGGSLGAVRRCAMEAAGPSGGAARRDSSRRLRDFGDLPELSRDGDGSGFPQAVAMEEGA